MIAGKYDLDFIRGNLDGEWKPFPPAADRKAWEKLLFYPVNRQRRGKIVRMADALLGKPWPALPATLYMEFARTGDRTVYENPCFARRQNLSILVLAECMKYEGSYMDEIANGLLAICEESTWVVPAHADRAGGDPLPPHGSHNIDLFNSESGFMIAEVLYALKKEIIALSPALHDRIVHELMKRIIVPFETYNDYWWLRGENNWSSWCAMNVLGTALCVMRDKDRLARIIDRLNAVNDRFISFYKEDGACPEGPMYWSVSAGTLAMYLEMLFSCTNGKIDLFNEPLIREMCLFILYSHIDGPWYANFGDSDAKLGSSMRPVIYRAAEMLNSDEFADFAVTSYFELENARRKKNVSLAEISCCANFCYYVRELFWVPADIRMKNISRRKTVWLPDLQLLVARETETDGKGIVLTAIGGDNRMGHSHNDIGNFTVYSDSNPVIIDAGIEAYRAKTFSSERYELWFTRGKAHNAPVVNGNEQKHGEEFRAENVKFDEADGLAVLQMNMEKAYPSEAGIESLVRKFTMKRKEKCLIEIADSLKMRRKTALIEINLLSLPCPMPLKKGVLEFNTGEKRLFLEFNPLFFKMEIEPVEIKDSRMLKNWGGRIYRIVFTSMKAAVNSEYSFRITG